MLSSVDRMESPKSYKTISGCPRFHLQIGIRQFCQFCHVWWMWESRMKEGTNKLASLVSSFNFGSLEMPIEKYMQLAWEEIIDGKYNIVEILDLTWGREIHLGLDGMKSEWSRMCGWPTKHWKSSFLKPLSMLNYHQILQWSILWGFKS